MGDPDNSEIGAPEHAAAADMAARAGALLLELRAGGLEGKALGAEGDRRSHRLLTDLLGERFPADPVRSEEADRSTGPASTPKGAPIGPCTWPSPSPASRSWVPSPYRGSTSSSTPDAHPRSPAAPRSRGWW